MARFGQFNKVAQHLGGLILTNIAFLPACVQLCMHKGRQSFCTDRKIEEFYILLHFHRGLFDEKNERFKLYIIIHEHAQLMLSCSHKMWFFFYYSPALKSR